MERPKIEKIDSGRELKKWYWLKKELVDFCRLKGINYSGSKFEILERLATSIDSNFKDTVKVDTKHKPSSKFIWSKSTLELNTIITESYTNGPNVRKFFKEHCGEKFHFSIPFMNFMKNNCGKNLQDAVDEWHRLNDRKKYKSFKSEIPEGNQYNKYLRDFFADNPDSTVAKARHFWKLKRRLPMGKHFYEKEDLNLK